MSIQTLRELLIIGLVFIGLFISLDTHAQPQQIGTFEFEASYSRHNSQVIISVNNTSTHRDDTMKCLTLPKVQIGSYRITNSPRDGWFFPDSISACAVFSNQFIHTGEFKFQINENLISTNNLTISYLSRSERRYTGTITVEGFSSQNVAPVADAGPDQVVHDTDGLPGEYVTLDASESYDNDTIVSYEWFTGNHLLATGKKVKVLLEDDSANTIELVVEDNHGAIASDFVTIITAPLTSAYNGVTPNPSYQLGVNNIGIYDTENHMLYLCVRMHAENALTQSEDGKLNFNLTLRLSDKKPLRFKVVNQSIFNPNGLLNEYGQTPDCSGNFDSTDRVITDIIQIGSLIGRLVMTVDNAANPTLTLADFEWLEFVVR